VLGLLAEIGAEHDLSIVQVRLLGVLRDRQPRMAQLARLLGLTKSSASGLIDRAARRGLVERTLIPVGDERAVHVVLTPGGRELVGVVAVQVARRLAALASDLSETDRTRLSRLLTAVVSRDADLHGVDLATERPIEITGAAG
jgi:DNA-binding MarR family transcriptional regulator